MKVGVKFCGNCNPHRYMPALLASLVDLAPGIEFVSWREADFDLLLILNGCQAACATKPGFTGQCVVVSNDFVNFGQIPGNELISRILRELQSVYEE